MTGDYTCEACGETIEDIIGIVKHDCVPVKLSARSLSKKEQNTLLYVESCVVGHAGKLDPAKMNHTDRQNLKVLRSAGLLEVSELKPDPDNPAADIQQVERFTDEAFDIARDCRQLRAYRDERAEFPVGIDG